MMNEWFECKVRYEKTLENGLVKKVTEPYLVDALSFTEAERRFYRRNRTVHVRRISSDRHQTGQIRRIVRNGRRCGRPLVQSQSGFHHP